MRKGERERGSFNMESRSPWLPSCHLYLMGMSLRHHQYSVVKTARFMVGVGGAK